MRKMFSENQIKSIIENGTINFKGDIQIEGKSAFQKFEGSLEPLTTYGLTVSGAYCKVVRNFNELQFILNCRVANETAETITLSNDTIMCYFSVNDEEIQNKIYSHSGLQCSLENNAGTIAYATLFIASTGGQASEQNPKYVSLYHINGNFTFYIEGGNLEITSNTTFDLEARISLAL